MKQILLTSLGRTKVQNIRLSVKNANKSFRGVRYFEFSNEHFICIQMDITRTVIGCTSGNAHALKSHTAFKNTFVSVEMVCRSTGAC